MAVWEARTFNQSEDLYSANWQYAPHMARCRGGSSQQVLDARGKEIVRSGTILDIGSARCKVSSQSVADAFYDVSFGPDGWRCTCPYHLHGNRRCKHIRAVYGTIMEWTPVFSTSFCNIFCTLFALIICLPPLLPLSLPSAPRTRSGPCTLWPSESCAGCSPLGPRAGRPRPVLHPQTRAATRTLF